MADEEKPKSEQRPAEQRRPIPRVYANNVVFEPSIWDLRIMFGEFDRTESGTGLIDWRVGVTIPFATAKLMSYYLQMNLAIAEDRGAPIVVPEHWLPRLPNFSKDDPMYQLAIRLRKEMFGTDPSPEELAGASTTEPEKPPPAA